MSIRRSLFFGALAAPLFLLACGLDPFPIENLGVPDGGAPPFVPPKAGGPHHDAGLPPPVPATTQACGSPSPFSLAVPVTSAFGGLATANGQVVLSVGGRGFTFDASVGGCPASAFAGPYQQMLGAIAYDGATVWAGAGQSIVALSPSGALLATCATTARGLASAPGTAGAYTIDGSGWRALSLVAGQCAVTPPNALDALDAPALAVAAAAAPGRIWIAARAPGGALSVERFDSASGKCVLSPSSGDPTTSKCTTVSLSPVCDVSSMVEVGGRLVVVDAACGRTWFFPIAAADPLQLGPPSSVAATSGFQPIGVAANPTRGDEVLVAEQAAITASTSVVQISRVTLP